MRTKVTVVGAGNVGATCAQELARRDYADIVLVDIKEGLPQGKALDIDQAGPVLGYEPSVVGTNGYEETAGSRVVVITAGLPRQPGMSRDDLGIVAPRHLLRHRRANVARPDYGNPAPHTVTPIRSMMASATSLVPTDVGSSRVGFMS